MKTEYDPITELGSLSLNKWAIPATIAFSGPDGEYARMSSDGKVSVDWDKCRKIAESYNTKAHDMCTMWAKLLWEVANPGIKP